MIDNVVKHSNLPKVQLQNTTFSHSIFEEIRRVRPTFLKEHPKAKTTDATNDDVAAGKIYHLSAGANDNVSEGTDDVSTGTKDDASVARN